MKHILDKDFRYVHSSSTDIKKTFDRVRREQEQARTNVTQIKKGRAPCSQK